MIRVIIFIILFCVIKSYEFNNVIDSNQNNYCIISNNNYNTSCILGLVNYSEGTIYIDNGVTLTSPIKIIPTSNFNLKIIGEPTGSEINSFFGFLQFSSNYFSNISISNLNIIGNGNNDLNAILVSTTIPSILTIQNSSISNFAVSNFGAAICALNVYVSLYKVTILNCKASQGGAIYSNIGPIYGFQSSFTNNYASDQGGALYAESVELISCIFSYNSAGNGGAISTSFLNVTSSNFIFNKAMESGGAIYLPNGGLNMVTESSFGYNNAKLYGGHLFSINAGYIQISNSVLSGGKGKLGGAIALTNSQGVSNLYLLESTFMLNNSTQGEGSDIYFEKGSVEVIGGIFNHNFKSNYSPAFPNFFNNITNVMMINSTEDCTFKQSLILNSVTLCMNITGQCDNGFGKINSIGEVIECNCFQGWSGIYCNEDTSSHTSGGFTLSSERSKLSSSSGKGSIGSGWISSSINSKRDPIKFT